MILTILILNFGLKKTPYPTLRDVMHKRDTDPNNPIDITIVETDTTFSVTFNRPGLVLTTGTGGFKMMLDRIGGSIDLMKTSYNGRILTLEEKQALVHRIKTL